MNSDLRGVDSEGWAACGLGSARFIREKGAQFLHQQHQFQGVRRLERQLCGSGFIRL